MNNIYIIIGQNISGFSDLIRPSVAVSPQKSQISLSLNGVMDEMN